MIKENFILLLCVVGLLNTNCQSQKKNNNSMANRKEQTRINILNIDFDNDLENLLREAEFASIESEFSEYLTAFTTKKIDSFKIGDVAFSSKYTIRNIGIKSDSYVSLVTQNLESTKILTIYLRINTLDNKGKMINSLEKLFGEYEVLNDENSVNKLKEKENYIWRDYENEYSIIVSQFSEGNVVSITDDLSIKVNSTLIYIIRNESIIDYPNGQEEKILERLIKRFSY